MSETGAGEVLVRTRVSLVSTGTELTALMADYPSGSTWEAIFPFPVHPGYDNVGEVVALGEGVDRAWLGAAGGDAAAARALRGGGGGRLPRGA